MKVERSGALRQECTGLQRPGVWSIRWKTRPSVHVRAAGPEVAPAPGPSRNGQTLAPQDAAQLKDNLPSTLHSSIVAPKQVQVPKPRTGPIVGPELGDLYKKFKKLQNGSDVRGIALEGVPNEPVSLSVGAVFFIGVAFARWLRAKTPDGPLHVSVGRDPRLSGPMVESALLAGLASEGVDVTLFGLATTPCMFYSCVETAGLYQGGIMITASHMPWNANGLKFFTPERGLEKTEIAQLVQTATQACAEAGVMLGEPWAEAGHVLAATRQLSGTVSKRDFRPLYARFLRQLIISGVQSKDAPTLPLLGLKIVVDAGNGAGGFFATEVLAPLGADITGSRYLDPDGSFPNHPPNPEHPAAMAAGAQAVLQSKADLGIVFDTDVDRSAIVDRSGREINSNKFIALMSAIILREHPGSTIVTDSVTSLGLTKFIHDLGGHHFRFKRGYKNVISKGIELNSRGVECHLMMETSGHGAVKSNYYLDDGAYLAVQVVIELVRRRLTGGDISELLSTLQEPVESTETRIKITDPDHGPIGKQVIQRFHDWVMAGQPGWGLDPVNHEGWRVNIQEGGGKVGWALLRQSLHDPLVVLNIESEVQGGAKATARKIQDFFLEKCAGLPLDLSTLKN